MRSASGAASATASSPGSHTELSICATPNSCAARAAVAPERRLALGAADDVIPVVLIEVLARLFHDLVQGLELGAGRAAAQRRDGFVGIDAALFLWRFIHG